MFNRTKAVEDIYDSWDEAGIMSKALCADTSNFIIEGGPTDVKTSNLDYAIEKCTGADCETD